MFFRSAGLNGFASMKVIKGFFTGGPIFASTVCRVQCSGLRGPQLYVVPVGLLVFVHGCWTPCALYGVNLCWGWGGARRLRRGGS